MWSPDEVCIQVLFSSFFQANPNLNLVGVTNWQFKFAIHFSANIDWKLGVLNVLTLADVTPRRKYESHMFFFWTDALELRLEAGLVFGGVGVAANCDGDFDRSRLPPPSVDQTANCRIDERNTAWRPERVRPRSVSSSGVLVPKVLNFDQFEISSMQALQLRPHQILVSRLGIRWLWHQRVTERDCAWLRVTVSVNVVNIWLRIYECSQILTTFTDSGVTPRDFAWLRVTPRDFAWLKCEAHDFAWQCSITMQLNNRNISLVDRPNRAKWYGLPLF